MLPQKLTNVITILISLVWTANVAVGFIRPELRDPMINAIFAIVVGTVYALGRRSGTSGNPTDTSSLDDARRRLGDLIAGNDRQPPGTNKEPTGTTREGDQ